MMVIIKHEKVLFVLQAQSIKLQVELTPCLADLAGHWSSPTPSTPCS